MSELLYQILLAVLIVAVFFLILVLWRLYNILTDFNAASEIIAKQVTALGALVNDIIKSLEGFRQSLKSFFESVKSLGNIKQKFSDFWEDDKKTKKEVK
jgi:hypothetical protein